jgi:hypothetical protein
MDITVERLFNSLYIYLDIIFLVIFSVILLWRKRYLALIAGAIGSIIYFVVDYGCFYQLMGTRQVTGADPMWLLLWLSISYGLTNFAWIWLLLDRDGHWVEWSLLIIAGWAAVAFLSQGMGTDFTHITISRGTASYHSIMAGIMFVGYLCLIIQNLRTKTAEKANLLKLLAIGIGVQFSWEAVLLLSNIRPTGIMPLIVDSIIETNLGIPFLYLIHRAVSAKINENLTKV